MINGGGEREGRREGERKEGRERGRKKKEKGQKKGKKRAPMTGKSVRVILIFYIFGHQSRTCLRRCNSY